MRFRLKMAGVLAAALMAAAPAGASLNPQHAGLQVALRAQGLYLGPIDAIIGPKTVAAVRAFQRVHGLHVTGIADVKTRRQLGPLGTPLFGSRTLIHGKFGWDVAVMQFLLNRHGVRVPVNAYMDRPTVTGVRRYQRLMHLPADGVAGPATFAALGLQTRVPVKAVQSVPLLRYVVKPGDSLTAIARKHRTTLSQLARVNKLDPSRTLLIGVKLRLPASVRRIPTAVSASDAGTVRGSLDRWAAHYGIDARLARALAWMESGYNNSVVSSVGAQGVMQLLPTTWDYVERVLIRHKVAHDADGNVHVGLAYLNHLLHAFDGNERLALAGWYQGERAVKATGLYKVTSRSSPTCSRCDSGCSAAGRIARGMKIAVCVKHVPEGQSRLDPSSKRLDRSGEGALNHFDANAVEEALRLKGDSDTEVVVVSLGPAKAADSLRKALAMGADRAVLVSDDAAAGSDLVATSKVLAKALERENADIVLFGQQASDGDGAVLWAAVAERLRRPVASQVAELTLQDGSLRLKRQTEFGYDVIEAPLPAVVAVSDAINEPRYPSLKGIMGAKKKPFETLSLGDVGVDAGDAGEAGSKTEVLALGEPPSRGDARKIEDDGSAAQQIVDFLAEKRLV